MDPRFLVPLVAETVAVGHERTMALIAVPSRGDARLNAGRSGSGLA